MTKKFLILLLTVIMMLSLVALCACGITDTDDSTTNDTTGDSTTGDTTDDGTTDESNTDDTVVTTYIVTFESKGGSSVDSQTVESGSMATKPESPTLEGYVFEGWLDYMGMEFDFGSAITADITLSADWSIVTYTVSFDGNIGSITEASQVVDYNTTATMPTSDPELAGYVFDCWVDATGAEFDFDATITADTVVTAKFYTDGLDYELNEEGDGYEIVGMGTADVAEIIIPDSYNNLPVVSIGESAFDIEYNENADGIVAVVMGDNVTYIGTWAFYGCYCLESLVLSYSVEAIDYGAFCYCSLLSSVAMGDGVKAIGAEAFAGCYSLHSLTLGAGLEAIDEDAFYGCEGLVEIYNLSSIDLALGSEDNGLVAYYAIAIHTSATADSVLVADSDGFVTCTDGDNIILVSYVGTATEVVIPDSITVIGGGAFYGNSNITSVIIGANVVTIGADSFERCTSLASVTISNGITSIGSYAFYYCISLGDIVIPESVTYIGNRAFASMAGDIFVEGDATDWDISWGAGGMTIYHPGDWEYVEGTPTPIVSSDRA